MRPKEKHATAWESLCPLAKPAKLVPHTRKVIRHVGSKVKSEGRVGAPESAPSEMISFIFLFETCFVALG